MTAYRFSASFCRTL